MVFCLGIVLLGLGLLCRLFWGGFVGVVWLLLSIVLLVWSIRR